MSTLAEISAEVKAAVVPVMEAFEEYKRTNDELRKRRDALTVEKLGKIEATLSSFEGVNQKLVAFDARQRALAEQQGAMDALLAKLEAKIGRPGAFSSGRGSAELKRKLATWATAVIRSYAGASIDEEMKKSIADAEAAYKALHISDDTTGGYLAPPEFVAMIIEAVVLISNARGIVTVRQTANKSVLVPKRTGVFAAQRVTEPGTRSETTGLTFGLEEIQAPECYAIIDVSNEDLEDSAFDLEAYIRENAAEQFAVLEGKEFISGTGTGQMEGVLSNAALGYTATGNTATLSADGVIQLQYAIKSAYARNAAYILNRKSIGAVRTLKDGLGNYLWTPGLANGVPNTIVSAPYYEFPDMPDVGANTYPIAFGDWKRAYVMADRIAMTFLRDPYTQGASGNVRMWFRRRVGGQVVLAEAINKLKCAAS